jgi:hypothetical protein
VAGWVKQGTLPLFAKTPYSPSILQERDADVHRRNYPASSLPIIIMGISKNYNFNRRIRRETQRFYFENLL